MSRYNSLKNLFLYLFSKRPRVFWWSLKVRHRVKFENFGDIITPYLVEKLTGSKPIYFEIKSRYSSFFSHSLMVGSIISYARKKSIVWGSGIIREDEVIKNGKFVAVRGPRTRQRLLELGFNAPAIYGDPGLLLPLLYNPDKKKRYDYGVIAHYIDEDELVQSPYFDSNVTLISLRTLSVETVIDKILECDKIISTSLHGVITAHAYGIPAIWWKYSDKLSGDDIKFTDYYESVDQIDIKNHNSLTLSQITNEATFFCPSPAKIKNLQKGLIESFPYKLKNNTLFK